MARNFDGTDDHLQCAANAAPSLTNVEQSASWWQIRAADPGATQVAIATSATAGTPAARTYQNNPPATSGFKPRLVAQNWTGAGAWIADNDVSSTSRHHIAMVYSGSATTNDPTLYVDGVSVAITETLTPTGSFANTEDTIRIGENWNNANDIAATLSHLGMQGSLWDAAAVNRAMWWGRPHGGLAVYYPLVTDTLTSEGVDAATLTATGTTVTSFVPPVVRPGTAMLGMGIGW